MGLENIGNPDISEKELKTEITAEDIREYDGQKAEYLKDFGIETEGFDHAEVVTTFIVFSHIGSLKLVEHRGLNLGEAVKVANNAIEEARFDYVGYRKDLGGGTTYEEVRKSTGHSANSECKVSEEEYSNILKHIFDSLRKA